jgi:hypothetical protein
MTIQLNDIYKLVIVPTAEQGTIHASEFEADDIWVVKTDHGPQFATRYTYTTEYAAEKKCYFKTGNATAAVKQAIITAMPGVKLKDIHFVIEKISTKSVNNSCKNNI